MNKEQIIDWLLEGDFSVQYQVHRDLLGEEREDIQSRISEEGWGKLILSKRKENGHWGERFYQPKWISTHYTLLDLRNLNLSRENELIRKSIDKVINNSIADDGGIQLGPSTSHHSDVCVNAMFLNYASYFNTRESGLKSVVDSILNEKMPDGGFNCRTNRSGAVHSSLHTTICVLEGFYEFLKADYRYRKEEITEAIKSSEEFILQHRFFLSDKTGEIISNSFLKLSYPHRWRYDILRALDYFQYANRDYDERMSDAIEVLLKKRNKNCTWNVQAAHPGQVHFVMEKAGKQSRLITLKVMRVLKHFDKENSAK